MPNWCSVDTTRPHEISVFFMVSDRCLITRVRRCSQVVLGGCWQNLVSFRMHGDRQFICFLDKSATAPVDCVANLYHIACVFQLFSTGSWAPRVMAGEFHTFSLIRCDGLQGTPSRSQKSTATLDQGLAAKSCCWIGSLLCSLQCTTQTSHLAIYSFSSVVIRGQ